MDYRIATRDAELIVSTNGADVVLTVQGWHATVRVPMTLEQAVELFGFLDVAIDAAGQVESEAE